MCTTICSTSAFFSSGDVKRSGIILGHDGRTVQGCAGGSRLLRLIFRACCQRPWCAGGMAFTPLPGFSQKIADFGLLAVVCGFVEPRRPRRHEVVSVVSSQGWLRPPLLRLSIEVWSGQGGYSDE